MGARPSLDEFEAENTGSRGTPCTIATVIETLDVEHAQRLQSALDAKHIQHAAIARVLTKWGHRVTAATVGRHRRQLCRCAG
jgi:hypothetical protein